MRWSAPYCFNITSMESNSPRVLITRGLPGKAFRTVRKPWPAEGSGNNAIDLVCPDECCNAGAKGLPFFKPGIPRIPEFAVPDRRGFSDIVSHRVQGPRREWLAR